MVKTIGHNNVNRRQFAGLGVLMRRSGLAEKKHTVQPQKLYKFRENASTFRCRFRFHVSPWFRTRRY